MMNDAEVVAVSPSTVRNVLRAAGLMNRWTPKPSSKGSGFNQPSSPHKHWHTDVTYINIGGTFYYLASVLDGYSRYMIHWELKPAMKEEDIELLIQRAREKFPGYNPRIISDNGPQFIANDFKEFIRLSGMTHVRTSPYYPQSNGKIESWHKSLKKECIRPACPGSYQDAINYIESFVKDYNDTRLHSALGYITPRDMLEGRQGEIHQRRDERLNKARCYRTASREMRRATNASVWPPSATSLGKITWDSEVQETGLTITKSLDVEGTIHA